MENQYRMLEVLELIQWHIDRFPHAQAKLKALLERAKAENFSDFYGDTFTAEEYYEQELYTILYPAG